MTGAGISGCRFQLKYLGGEVSGSGGTVIGTYTTSANGSFTVTGAQKGLLHLRGAGERQRPCDRRRAPVLLYFRREPGHCDPLFLQCAQGAVLVKKVSSADNSPLSDVEFLVARSDGSVVGNNNGKFVTDSTGTFLVEGWSLGPHWSSRRPAPSRAICWIIRPRPSRSRRARPSQ